MKKTDPFYQSPGWRQLRTAVLKRDDYKCQLAYPGCLDHANTADHIVAREDGGADHPANLRSVCFSCHNKRHPEKGTA